MEVVTLRIFLMGLVALVPHTQDEQLTILLPEAHGHIPVLIYEEESRVCEEEGCQVGDGLKIAELLHQSAAAPGLLLNRDLVIGDEIKIQAVGTEEHEFNLQNIEKTRYFADAMVGVVPKTREDQFDLTWISRMSEIMPGSATVKEGLLDKSEHDELAGRLTLQEGDLRIVSFADVQGEVRSVTFRPLGSSFDVWGVKQAVADIAVISLPVKADPKKTITIKLEPFKGCKTDCEVRELRLKSHGGVVDVLLGNLSPLPDYDADLEAPAEHFALYTNLTYNPKKPTEMPIPHLGWSELSSVNGIDLEEDEVPVIRSVSGAREHVRAFARRDGSQGGSNRPICTLVVMSAPAQFHNPPAPLEQVPQESKSGRNQLTAPLIASFEGVRKEFLGQPGISGVDIGCPETGDGLAVRVHVTEEAKRDDTLKKLKLVVVEGVPVRVLVARYVAEQSPGKLKAGASIRLDAKNARTGTLGLVVEKDENGKPAFISAGHVLDKSNEDVVSPASGSREVGEVKRVELSVDAALATINNGVDYKVTAFIKGVRLAAEGDIVQKDSSASTHPKIGKVCGRGVYTFRLGGQSRNIEGFQIVPLESESGELTLPGDSGALWYVDDGGQKRGVGLNIAGEESASDPEYAIASDLCRVLEELKVPESNWTYFECD